jgi:hypothetical protein
MLLLTAITTAAAACASWACPQAAVVPAAGDLAPIDSVITWFDPESYGAEAHLYGPDGQEVAGEIEVSDDGLGRLWVLTPDAHLAPGEDYTVSGGGLYDEVSFQTSAVEAALPGTAQVRREETRFFTVEGDCPNENLVSLTMAKPEEVAWFEVEASADRDTSQAVTYRGPGPTIDVGQLGCAVDVPNFNRAERLYYRVRALGFDGTPGPWVEGAERARASCLVSTFASPVLLLPCFWGLGRRRRPASSRR